MQVNIDENRYEDMIEELCEMSELEIRSLAIKDSDIPVLLKILEYKIKKEKAFIKKEIAAVINKTENNLGR